jgi:hypothetical protein
MRRIYPVRRDGRADLRECLDTFWAMRSRLPPRSAKGEPAMSTLIVHSVPLARASALRRRSPRTPARRQKEHVAAS